MVRKSTVLVIGILTLAHVVLITEIFLPHFYDGASQYLISASYSQTPEEPAGLNEVYLLERFGLSLERSHLSGLQSRTAYSPDRANYGSLTPDRPTRLARSRADLDLASFLNPR